MNVLYYEHEREVKEKRKIEMTNLPKFVTKQLAAHDFNSRIVAHINRYGQNVKPRIFTAAPMEVYMNSADAFGERHIIIEEKSVMTGEIISKWTAVVGNGQCYQI